MASVVELRTLGPLELWAGDTRVALPRSKKTRALLAYLAITGRAHRRERLCSLWDVTDDPRGALRWSLSRLRRVLGELGPRIVADRQQVELARAEMRVDAHQLREATRRDACRRPPAARGHAGTSADIETAELERLAAVPRGEFLESLDLIDFFDFNAWCVAEREGFRQAHCAVLSELVARLRGEPARALPHARAWVQADAFDVDAHLALLQLLLAAARVDEARKRYDSARRLFAEVGAAGVRELDHGWRQMLALAERVDAAPARAPAQVERASHEPADRRGGEARARAMWPFVGRQSELAALEAVLARARRAEAPAIALVTGEPGSGKSRLAERLGASAQNEGFVVLTGRAYEAESSRPYGPWVDALHVGLGDLLAASDGDEQPGKSRDALFAAVIERVASCAAEGVGAVLMLDDLQWIDSDSAELLHYVARSYSEGPLLIVLMARPGELADNEAGLRALRGMRRQKQVEEIALEPLSRHEIAVLIGEQEALDVAGIYEASAGNPLYAIELARAQSSGLERAPATLVQLVRERVEQLPDHAADVLRWGAVLGHAVDIERLESLSSFEPDEIVDALERLEHNALLRIEAMRKQQRYVFSHDVVREAVYGELSHPRRRMMHRKVAQLLEPQTSEAAVATEVAHHAGLSFLRWESSSMAAAHDNIMQAERVSRSAAPAERTVALAQAAKCLVLLERKLGQAEAFVMEARALSSRAGRTSSAVSFAAGMIAAHRGELELAVESFREARQLAREHGDRLAEFCALEHRVMLEIDRGGYDVALELGEHLVDLGARVRAGAEAPAGRALFSLIQQACGQLEQDAALDEAIEELRIVDAKYEMAFLLTRRAEHARTRGRLDDAQRWASGALEVARAIGRPSETAMALAVLVCCARQRDDQAAYERALGELDAIPLGDLSRAARERLEAARAGPTRD